MRKVNFLKNKLRVIGILSMLVISIFSVSDLFSFNSITQYDASDYISDDKSNTQLFNEFYSNNLVNEITNQDEMFSTKKSNVAYLGYKDNILNFEATIPNLEIEDCFVGKDQRLYQRVIIDGEEYYEQPGYPRIPFESMKILIPLGKDVDNIQVITGEQITLEGNYVIEPVQMQIPIGSKELYEFSLNDEIYRSDDRFPKNDYLIAGSYFYRGYQVVYLNIFPVQYIPKTGVISYYKDLEISVNLKDTNEINPLFRGNEKDQTYLRQIVSNPQLKSADLLEKLDTDVISTSYSPLLDSTLSYDYVIITSEALKNSLGAYTFQDLVDLKKANNINTTIVTVEGINTNYTGNDLQEKIRNFITDAYLNWGIEYVLLGGDGDGENLGGESENAIIPSRGFYVDIGGTMVDENIPSDLYYAALDGTWDTDEDNLWGEPGEDDLLAEIYIGRAPIDSEEELSNFIMKTIAHELSEDPYLYKALMVGEILGWVFWGADYMDEIIYGSDLYGYSTVGIEDEYSIETLYDWDIRPSRWDKSDIIPLINEGVHVINHLGHSNVDYNMKMVNEDVDSLTNEKYSFIYSQGCYNGAFDNRGTYPDEYFNYDCITEHFVTTPHGAFACVGNSRYGWGNRYDTNGASQHYNREFYDAIYGEGIEEIGKANQDSKVDSIGFLSPDNPMRWCYYEANLFGDPTASINLPPFDHDIAVLMEIPKYAEIFTSHEINATVINRGTNNENSVNLTLFVDSIAVNSTLVDLDVDEIATITYNWTASDFKVFNFTTKATNVFGESLVENNIKSEFLEVLDLTNYYMTEIPFSWYDAYQYGINLNIMEGYGSVELYSPFDFYDQVFSTIYISLYGYLSFEDESPTSWWYNPMFPNSKFNYVISPFWNDLLTEHIYAWITEDYTVIEYRDCIYRENGIIIGNFEVIFFNTGEIQFQYQNVTIDYGSTVGLNYGKNIMFYNAFTDGLTAISDFALSFTVDNPESHNIKASLSTPIEPLYNELNLINATVKNVGTCFESNVLYSLLLNNSVVDTLLIDLDPGETAVIQYPWTPTEYQTYNFTAKASPVENELLLANNEVTKLLQCRGINIVEPISDQIIYGSRAYVSFNSGFSLNHINSIEIFVNENYITTINVDEELNDTFVPIFQNGTNLITLTAHWDDGFITNASVSIISEKVEPIFSPQIGDYIDFIIKNSDIYYQSYEMVFDEWISDVEIRVLINNLVIENGEIVDQIESWCYFNILNGYVSDSDLYWETYQFPFVMDLSEMQQPPSAGSPEIKAVFNEWNDFLTVEGNIAWRGYECLTLTSRSGITVYACESNNLLTYLEPSGELGVIGYIDDTSFMDFVGPSLPLVDDITYEYGIMGNKITWEPTDSNPDSYIIYQDGIEIDSDTWVSGVPIEINLDYLEVGTYEFNLTIWDIYGAISTDIVIVEVINPILPVVNQPEDFSYTEGTENNNITWIATDTNPDTYIITRDGIEVDSGTWISGEPIIININGLSEGIYDFTIVISDLLGYSVSDSVIVTVSSKNIPGYIIPFLVISLGVAISLKTNNFFKKKKFKKNANNLFFSRL